MYLKIESKKKRFFFFIFLYIFLPIFSFSDNLKISILEKALKKNLDNSHIWHRLLHLDKSLNPYINNKSFLISYPNFSPKKELIATIKLFEQNKKAVCKYPARYYWLENELNISNSIFSKKNCLGFNEYIEKTNPTDLKLVFVSEQVKNPSSMMGHTFFKLIGYDKNYELRENAISFFTIIDTFNIPYLILKSFITGMKGLFILSPYKTQVNRYLKEENRNIWEYDLNLSDFQKKLIYYHFWELKDIDITYLFTGFNCATIVDDMLGIYDKNYKKKLSLWVTPKDVIKKANKYNLIKNSILIPSINWELNMLSESISNNSIDKISEIVVNKKYDKLKNFKFSSDKKNKYLEKKLAITYGDFLYDKNIKKIVKNDQKDNYCVDLSRYKNPIKTFNDSQFSISYQNIDNEKSLKLNFLPASNRLYDDNREYFSESSLKIGEFSLLVDKKNLSLDSLNIFSMKSFIPWNTLTKTLSNDFKFNYEKQYSKNLKPFHSINLNGGFGITKKIHNDMSIFTLLDVGIAYGNNSLYPYLFSQIGLIIYEIFNMKSTIEYKYFFNQDNSQTGYHDLNLEQSLFFNKKYRVGIFLNHKKNSTTNLDSFGLSFNYFF